jgi:diguanylate cyclase (GGDEF)-like protein
MNNPTIEAFVRSQPMLWREPLAVICLELGGLAEIRAEYGFGIGDRIVTEIVARLRIYMRPADILFRYQSDEIFVVQFKTGREAADVAATQIGRAMRDSVSGTRTHDLLKVLIGVSTMPEDGRTPEALMTAAQQRAKETAGAKPGAAETRPESIH